MDPQNQNYGNESEKQGLFSLPRTHVILTIILCLVSIGSISYLLLVITGQQKALESAYKTVLYPLKRFFPAPSPTPAIDITSDWNIYNSTSSAFSIKYPKDWNAKNTGQTDPKILEYVVFNPVGTKMGRLFITLTYTARAYKEILDEDPHQVGENVTVASVSATRKIKQDSQRNPAITVAVPLNGGEKTIILYGREIYRDIFNQMLTTLQFATQ